VKRVIVAYLLTSLLAQDAFAAIQFAPFRHCSDGLVSAATCECHANTSRHWHFCQVGQYCHTLDGTCTNCAGLPTAEEPTLPTSDD
jgi:hypothetical protein